MPNIIEELQVSENIKKIYLDIVNEFIGMLVKEKNGTDMDNARDDRDGHGQGQGRQGRTWTRPGTTGTDMDKASDDRDGHGQGQ